ncbi:MAG: RHS repeat protein [Chitinophagaceae bacterium]|nr:RHS repeat protein [Chitinophagaceae bacterium]
MKKQSTFCFIILFLFYFIPVLSWSQKLPSNQVQIASPTAASLGKYADIPVSYHTGLPQISIPLYTIKSGPLSLPISLSYHASGLKVMEPSSWVGAGWSLNAGGVITRSVVGLPDEYGTSTNGAETNGHFSHYGYNSYLYNAGQQDWQPFADGRKDGEPDLFFFNFNGISGKFFFSDDRTPVLLPEQDLKIEYDYTLTSSLSIQGFIITTSDGTKYYFGKTASSTDVDPLEKTLSYTATAGTYYWNIISSWYLNKIESADAQFVINLTYQADNYGYYTTSMSPIDGNKTGTGYQNTGYNLVKNIMQGVRLSQISFADGNVTFNAGSVRTDLADNGSNFSDNVNTSSTSLGNIQINGNGGFCKKFLFTYNYFTDNTSALTGDYAAGGLYTNIQTDKKRLRLESVQESSCAGETISPYQFLYFTEQVPRMLSFGIDHWGFYNGVTNNQGLIPAYTKDNVVVPGANRDAAWPPMRGGVLQKITYPTGGYTLFDFEPHNMTTSTTSYDLTTVAGLAVHQLGQSQITQTVPFTVINTGNNTNNCKITIHNNSTNWSATLSIKNSSNVEQGPWLVPVSQTYTQTLTLPPGNYSATLSFPANSASTLVNGADASIQQWQYQSVQSVATIGGLRVKTITQNDGFTTKDIVTNYDYKAGGSSSAIILYGRPRYVQTIRNDLIRDVGFWTTTGFQANILNPYGCPGNGGLFYKSPGSIMPMATSQGSHVGYFEVQVRKTGQGKTIYRYYGNSPFNQNVNDVVDRVIFTTSCDANTPNYPAAPLPYDFIRGELKYEGHYNESGQVLKEINYTPVYQNSTISTPGFIVHTRLDGSTPRLLGTFYSLTSAKKTQMITAETNYTPGVGSVTTTKTEYYESAFHNAPTRTTLVSSGGGTLETRMTYAFDFRSSSCDATSNGIQTLATSLATCQTNYNNARAACGGASACLTTAYFNYLTCQNQARIAYINTRKSNFTDPTNAFQTCHNSAKTNANTDLKPLYELQDSYNNALVEQSTWRANNLTSGSFTRYNYGTNPTTKIYPEKVQTLSLLAPSSTFTPSVTAAGNASITKDSRYLDEYALKFNKGNLVEQYKINVVGNDISTTYLWGYNNQYPVAKIVGATSAAAQALITQTILDSPASDAAMRTELDKLRTGLPAAQVTTYTYNQLKGITSETDPSGKTIYYEYDNFGRLKTIKDPDGNVLKTMDYQYQKPNNQ